MSEDANRIRRNIITMNRDSVAYVNKHHMVRRLLTQDLPKMQASALKHEFLTTVANTLRNPVATENGPDGRRYTIGFGNVERTLPILVIQEAEGDDTVRHAHVPYLNDPIQMRLLRKLQSHENEWAKERGAQPRNIIGQIREEGVDEINQHGINRYSPAPFNKQDREDMMRGKWYPTQPLSSALEINQSGSPQLKNTPDRNRLQSNVGNSAVMAGARSGPQSIAVALTETSSPRRLKIEDIRVDFEDTHLDGPEL